ncbi:MAG: hypothetical protein ABI377_00680 [Devosia sp.]
MDLWVGPALIAAVVSGVVSVFGWFATFYIGLRRDQMLRDERVHDFQVALRAEIVSDLLSMSVMDRKQFRIEATERYASQPGYTIIVPHMARNPVFESLVGEVHILPAEIIEPVIHYERLRETVERFVADLRDVSFRQSPAERQLLMYSDYLDMLGRLELLARDAVAAINESLNIPVGDRWSPPSASAAGGVSAEASKQP